MAHAVLWPRKSFFYPIGNTSAICLTQNLAHEEPAKVLLLGCGDPRNILYTLYNSSPTLPRTYDFTCCDIEPAILARNVIMLTMISDNHDQNMLWNIFFHMRLDKPSLNLLVAHCQALITHSSNVEIWQSSKYASFLRFCSSHTLDELRRHWGIYVEIAESSGQRTQLLQEGFKAGMKSAFAKGANNLITANSAGYAWPYAYEITRKHFEHYWKTGTSSVDANDVAAAVFINPTFAYSLSGERFAAHYVTDPLAPFHLAPLFASNAISSLQGSKAIEHIVSGVKAQFSSWCKAFRASINSKSAIIRMFTGDALAFCEALHHRALGHPVDASIYRAPWSAQPINLDGTELDAPLSFNVIDTSNLTDHLALLNIIIAALPIMSRTPTSVIHTETLLPAGKDATKGFIGRVCADIPTLSIILDISPSAYLTPFTTNSNSHDVLLQQASGGDSQFHERISWKCPSLGDPSCASQISPASTFDAPQLARILFDIYLKMFSDENMAEALRNTGRRQFSERSMIHYVRGTFVALLALVKDRVDTDWQAAVGGVLDMIQADHTLIMGSNNYQEFCCLLHIHGVFSVPTFSDPVVPLGRLSKWKNIPPVVCIVLVVPRTAIKVLEDMDEDVLGTPIIQCETRGAGYHNIFSSIRAAFGKVIPKGSESHPVVALEEDPAGWGGASPLVVSFWIAAWNIPYQMDSSIVTLTVRHTPATASLLTAKLGYRLDLFTTKMMDNTHLHIVAERPNMPNQITDLRRRSHRIPVTPSVRGTLGTTGSTQVTMGSASKAVESLTIRVNIEDSATKEALSKGLPATATQKSSCTMELTIAGRVQPVSFPFPIIGSRSKVRIARKSLYIEVVVPISESLGSGGYSMNPFPVIIQNKTPTPWNIHTVNLERSPILDTARKVSDLKWIDPHVALAMSDRERSLQNQSMFTDPFGDMKASFHAICVQHFGIQGTKTSSFSLLNDSTRTTDTFLFIANMRSDLAPHTVVAEAFVLNITEPLLPIVAPILRKDTGSPTVHLKMFGDELRVWKQALPAFAERCRTWKHKKNCEYLVTGNVPLSVEDHETPMCSCGIGKDVEALVKFNEWRDLAPFVTRVALGPLFAVSYLESVGSTGKMKSLAGMPTMNSMGPDACAKCGGAGKPKLLICGKCKGVKYCSAECQQKDWNTHKAVCKK